MFQKTYDSHVREYVFDVIIERIFETVGFSGKGGR